MDKTTALLVYAGIQLFEAISRRVAAGQQLTAAQRVAIDAACAESHQDLQEEITRALDRRTQEIAAAANGGAGGGG